MKVAVLMGGTSAERDVSLVTGLAVAGALRANGHTVLAIDCAYGAKTIDLQTMDSAEIIRQTPPDIEKQRAQLDRNIFDTVRLLLDEKVAVVYNALHGGYGENGQLQAVLDLAGIAYTGSNAVASALGLDKHLSKVMFQASEVPTAFWEKLNRPADLSLHRVEAIGLPLVVKPNEQGSTVGLSIVHDIGKLAAAVDLAFEYSPTVILEKFIAGRELTVAVLAGEALPIVEIVIDSGIYDYEAKYQGGRTRYFCPADLPADLAVKIQQAAVRGYQALGCRGYARIDFRLQDDGQFFCLEANTLPGMTPTSLVPKAAKAAGMDFNTLIEKIITLATPK